MASTTVKTCFITSQEVENISSDFDGIHYSVSYCGSEYEFKFQWNHENTALVKYNLHVLRGILLNSQFPKKYYVNPKEILTNEILERLILDAPVPRTPHEKLDNILLRLHSLAPYDGAEIDFMPQIKIIDEYANSLYLKDDKELMFYLGVLERFGLIEADMPTIGSGNINVYPRNITFEGLQRIIEIQEYAGDSKRCFVAMSFSEDMTETRETIRDTIIKTGFNPIFIDEVHYPADQTLHEGMLKEIKRAKFLVSDFTQQKHGVYFEAGYALGLGRYVIYMSSKKDFKNCHFDTKSFPHIVYNNLEELRQKLEDKIEVHLK